MNKFNKSNIVRRNWNKKFNFDCCVEIFQWFAAALRLNSNWYWMNVNLNWNWIFLIDDIFNWNWRRLLRVGAALSLCCVCLSAFLVCIVEFWTRRRRRRRRRSWRGRFVCQLNISTMKSNTLLDSNIKWFIWMN